MNEQERNNQWREVYLTSLDCQRVSALGVVWGYLDEAEKRGVPVEATDLLNLIVERLKGGAR